MDAAFDHLANTRTSVAVLSDRGERLNDTADIRAAQMVQRGRAKWVTHDPPVIQLLTPIR
jgi:hypothetical protein